MPGVANSWTTGASLERPQTVDGQRLEKSERRSPSRSVDEAGHPTDVVSRVLWTRGGQCHALAEALSGGSAIRADADVATSCIRLRASLLVTRHLNSLDLCSLAVPHGYSPTETRAIVAAVGGGPHSRLAATVGHLLGQHLGVPVRAIYGYHDSSEEPQVLEVLNATAAHLPGIDVEAVRAPSPAAIVDTLAAGTLLVVGAPGGSWFQRQFFGQGARIRAKAPTGTIVVKHTPTRVYQIMQPATAFGPHMRVADALQLADAHHLIVAEHGRLLGLVPHRDLAVARPDLELRDIMENPVFLAPDEDLDHATELIGRHPGSAIPVVDARDRIVGSVTIAELAARPLF